MSRLGAGEGAELLEKSGVGTGIPQEVVEDGVHGRGDGVAACDYVVQKPEHYHAIVHEVRVGGLNGQAIVKKVCRFISCF